MNNFNRVFGFESKLQSNNTKFKSELYYHQSEENNNSDGANSYGINASYEERNFETNIYFYGVGENFNPEVGLFLEKIMFFLVLLFNINFYQKIIH